MAASGSVYEEEFGGDRWMSLWYFPICVYPLLGLRIPSWCSHVEARRNGGSRGIAIDLFAQYNITGFIG